MMLLYNSLLETHTRVICWPSPPRPLIASLCAGAGLHTTCSLQHGSAPRAWYIPDRIIFAQASRWVFRSVSAEQAECRRQLKQGA